MVVRVTEAAQKLRQGIERSDAYAEEVLSLTLPSSWSPCLRYQAMEEDAFEILQKFLQRPAEIWAPVFEDIHVILKKLEEHRKRHGTVR